ncbi:MAG TPA: rhodanese-like domain-containing protein [Oligoflexia bacterium]|nr:rhodanese-like domain-containing protein [Oligoflexia bacterium]
MLIKKTIVAGLFSLFFFSVLGLQVEAKTDCSDDSRYGEIEKSELQAKIKDGKVSLIDVNDEETFAKNKIGNAINYYEKKNDLAWVLPKDKSALVVAYCGSTRCTAWKKAAKAACEMGYTNVKHFKPGIKGWMASS